MKKEFYIIVWSLLTLTMLSACQSSSIMPSKEETILEKIELDRNFKPMPLPFEGMSDENLPDLTLWRNATKEMNKVDSDCIPKKVSAFDKSKEDIIGKYNTAMTVYQKCAQKYGVTVTWKEE